MCFFIAVKDARERGWRFLFRSESLADALDVYRAMVLKAGQCKVLAELDRAGHYGLLHAVGEMAQADTEQARFDRTDHAKPQPRP